MKIALCLFNRGVMKAGVVFASTLDEAIEILTEQWKASRWPPDPNFPIEIGRADQCPYDPKRIPLAKDGLIFLQNLTPLHKAMDRALQLPA